MSKLLISWKFSSLALPCPVSADVPVCVVATISVPASVHSVPVSVCPPVRVTCTAIGCGVESLAKKPIGYIVEMIKYVKNPNATNNVINKPILTHLFLIVIADCGLTTGVVVIAG